MNGIRGEALSPIGSTDAGTVLLGAARNDESYDNQYEALETNSSPRTAASAHNEARSIVNDPSQIEMTDEELMLAVCLGDKSAYQTLVKQHIKSISHFAFRILGNQKDTEDITQEVFLRLWTNAEKWKADKSKLTTWLHRITHNLCIDYLRKHGRVQTQDSFDDEQDDSLSTNSEPREARSDDVKRLNEAISLLPENQRTALTLCHYQGFSNKEAADIMNISVKALESAIARAKRSLREKIQNSENHREQ